MIKSFFSLVKITIKKAFYFKTYLSAFLNLYIFHTCRCYICGTKNLKIHKVNWRRCFIECDSCELVFIKTPPNLNKLRRIHDKAYWKKINEELGCYKNPLAWEDWQGWKSHLLNYFNIGKIEEDLGKERKVLDIGCGNGKLLELFYNRGWQCVGIDLSDYTKDLKLHSGIEIINFSFEDSEFPEGEFDFITMIHVVEHFIHPYECLEKARITLKEFGYLLIETPLVPDYDDLHHQSFYSRKSLYKLIEKSEMNILKEKTYKDELHLGKENILLLCQKKR